jgi:hypothetical protein
MSSGSPRQHAQALSGTTSTHCTSRTQPDFKRNVRLKLVRAAAIISVARGGSQRGGYRPFSTKRAIAASALSSMQAVQAARIYDHVAQAPHDAGKPSTGQMMYDLRGAVMPRLDVHLRDEIASRCPLNIYRRYKTSIRSADYQTEPCLHQQKN